MASRDIVTAEFGSVIAGFRLGDARAEAGMRPALIVMGYPLLENSPQVSLIERNQKIQTFTALRHLEGVTKVCS